MPDATTYTSKLHGSTALVIGGTSGLGFGVASALVEHGASHVIISSSQQSRIDDALQRLRKAYPDATADGKGRTKLSGFTCSLGKTDKIEEEVKGLFEKVQELLGGDQKLDHVVHSAGDAIVPRKPEEWSVERAIEAGNVRYFGPLMVVKYAKSVLKERGSITLTTGGAADRPIAGWTLTVGYLAALSGITRSLALDLAPIRVNLVSPGGVDTEMWDALGSETKAETLKGIAKNTTTGRVGRVEDVVESYLCAMKDENMSGTVLKSDSGHALV